MDNKPYVSYSKCYKPKEKPKLIPEYLVYTLKNRDKQKHTNYRVRIDTQK